MNFCSSKQLEGIKERHARREKEHLVEKSESPAGFEKKYGIENSSVQLPDHQLADFSIVSN